MTVIDDKGRFLLGNTLFAAICSLIAKSYENPTIAMSVTAPSRIEQVLNKQGVEVLRTKADTRSIMSMSVDAGVTFAGDDRGGFIFPDFHPGFDAPFTFAKLVKMLQTVDLPLSAVVAELPAFQLAYEQVRCPWESKGVVMRRISEEQKEGARIELLDGIKIYDKESWVLVLPDAVEPLFHVYAESDQAKDSRTLVGDYVKKIQELQAAV
jgi:mannose-1-phosphate guanylyltransferase/phosphomannomutase